MIKILLLILLVSCTAAQKAEDIISSASFGTKESRVQFHTKGKYIKYSPLAGSFDNTSGATLSLVSNENNTFIYTAESGEKTIKVSIEKNSVTVTEDTGNTIVFTPKSRNLGKRPR